MVFQLKTALIFTVKNKNKTALAASFEIRQFITMYKDAHLPRKFLVVVDGTPESRAALRWAERRAHGNGGQLALLVVLEPGGFEHWLGVETLMKEEAKENAEQILSELSAEVEKIAGRSPETHIMEGERIEQVMALINSDKTISTLVLAAGTDPAGPGPLVGALEPAKQVFISPLRLCRAS